MQKGNHINESDTDEDVDTKLADMSVLAAADGNTDVAALGALAVTASGAYIGARSADGLAQIASTTATDTKNSKKSLGITAYNNVVDKANIVYKLDPDHIKALGFTLSKIATDKAKCEKITGGEWEQFIHDGYAEVKWKTLGTEADYYTIEEGTGDLTVEANWYPANPPTCKKADVVVKPKILNIPVSWRITGNNSKGPGLAPSDPIGGKPIH
jgi:hypothetical protein